MHSPLPHHARFQVGVFFGLALLGPLLAGAVLRAFTDALTPLVSMLVVAVAMPAPLVAAMITGPRPAGPALLASVRAGFRRPLETVLLPVAGALVWLVSAVGLTAGVGNLAGIPGIGRLATGPEAVRANLADQLGSAMATSADLPSVPVGVLVIVAAVSGVVAGLTINGLLAFGEEYGWRGVLWSALEQGGKVATIGAVGVLWGSWHAPLILLVGYNYPEHRFAGVVAMILFTTAAAWPLDELRRVTRSPVAPAILHGSINGMASIFIVISSGNRLLTPPVGLLGALAMLPVGALLYVVAPRLTDASIRDQGP